MFNNYKLCSMVCFDPGASMVVYLEHVGMGNQAPNFIILHLCVNSM